MASNMTNGSPALQRRLPLESGDNVSAIVSGVNSAPEPPTTVAIIDRPTDARSCSDAGSDVDDTDSSLSDKYSSASSTTEATVPIADLAAYASECGDHSTAVAQQPQQSADEHSKSSTFTLASSSPAHRWDSVGNATPPPTYSAGENAAIAASEVPALGISSAVPNVSIPPMKKNLLYHYAQLVFEHCKSSGIGEPSVYHALVVIFLEFFAWGLLTMPLITVLNKTFPDHTLLMNGLVMGIKGILSFLSAPLIGALSDVWGRKFFLLITVFFTCLPIPLMTINEWWFFALISISGVFAVTFSVVFAYVADVTTTEERSKAYGLVSATFAASLVISPALGAYLGSIYSDTLVVALATAIAVLDVFFILVAVPESLSEKVRPSSWGAPISWEQADPFSALRKATLDNTILMHCITVFLSYLPEAGQYSCIFVYLKMKMDFSSLEVSIFIAVIGILSIMAQLVLGFLMRVLGAKRTIILGLLFEMTQMLWYGFGSQTWMMWAAGFLASLGSITYPAISAFVSIHSNADTQGVAQGMVTGMRGLCNGLGPAMFGIIFYVFHVDLNDNAKRAADQAAIRNETVNVMEQYTQFAPGPPFVFGAFMVVLAILVALFIPEEPIDPNHRRPSGEKKKRASVDIHYEIESGRRVPGSMSPLMHHDSAQL